MPRIMLARDRNQCRQAPDGIGNDFRVLMRRGDEFVVRMPGPWDGPVRVVRREADSFRLATLAGHLEAGEIEFRATGTPDALGFEIESWARAGEPASAVRAMSKGVRMRHLRCRV